MCKRQPASAWSVWGTLSSISSWEDKHNYRRRAIRKQVGPGSKTERTLHNESCLEMKQAEPKATRTVSLQTLMCKPDGHLLRPCGQQLVEKAGGGACEQTSNSQACKLVLLAFMPRVYS